MAIDDKPGKQPSLVMLAMVAVSVGYAAILMLCAGIVVCSGLSEPKSYPGDVNIGGGILLQVAMLGVPLLIGWGLRLAARL